MTFIKLFTYRQFKDIRQSAGRIRCRGRKAGSLTGTETEQAGLGQRVDNPLSGAEGRVNHRDRAGRSVTLGNQSGNRWRDSYR